MTLGARNVIKGRVVSLEMGAVNVEVCIEVSPEMKIVSTITKNACAALELEVGQEAFAVIKASNVMVAVK